MNHVFFLLIIQSIIMINVNESPEFKRFYIDRGVNHEYEAYLSESKSIVSVSFENSETMIRCVEQNRDNNTNKWHARGFDQFFSLPKGKGDTSWSFGDAKNLDETNNRLSKGICTSAQLKIYENYVQEIYEKYPELNDIESMAVMTKKRKSFSEDGDELDIDRYMDGAPEMWSKKTYRAGLKRTARLNYYMPTSAANDPSAFVKNICFLAAFSDIVERAGISLEINIGCAIKRVTNTEDLSIIFTRFKSANEQLDIERLISSGNAGLFRYYFFACLDNITRGHGNWGLGSCMMASELRDKLKDYDTSDISIIASDAYRSLIENKDEVSLAIKSIKKIFHVEAEEFTGSFS